MAPRSLHSAIRHGRLIDALEPRRLLSASPKLSLAHDIEVPAGQTIQVPISGTSANGKALAYAVNSVSGLTATFHPASNSYLELNTTAGVMRFQLFDDLAPETVARVRGLAESGFYDGLDFYRVVNSNGYQVAQTGSPNNDGTGGPTATFDDEFSPLATFDTPGLLGMGVAGNTTLPIKDANRSEFFVTGAAARDSLDFNNTIFGILVRGGKTLDSIIHAKVGNDYKPTNDVTIRSARVVDSPSDAVLQITANKKTGVRKLTISATDTSKKKTADSISVTVVPDTLGEPPILAPIPDVIYSTPGASLRVPIHAVGRNLEQYEINAIVTQGTFPTKAELNTVDKTLDLTLDPNYTGPLKITVGVKDLSAVSRGLIFLQPGQTPSDLSLYDTQTITISVSGGQVTGSAPDTVHAYPNVKLDGELIATFKSDDVAATASDFTAQIAWGDGGVTAAADVRPVDGGFAVYGTHTYARTTTGSLPLRVRVASSEGGAITLKSDVVVADELNVDDQTGLVAVNGSNAADAVRLSVDGNALVIRIGTDEQRVALDRVERIAVDLFGGDDTFAIDDPNGVLPGVSINGGDGDDQIDGGNRADTIDGGAGDDRLGGGGGDDVIHGSAGDDSILGGSGKNKLYGDDGDDRLTGSAGPEQLFGGDGADKLYGRAGDDTLDGGGGTDRLYGEEGNDVLIGGGSADRCYGGPGNDTLYGNAGSDTLDGGEDDDKQGDKDGLDVIRSI